MLTEEELLAAPEDDYMNDEQLAFFQQRLHEMRQSLIEAGETERPRKSNTGFRFT